MIAAHRAVIRLKNNPAIDRDYKLQIATLEKAPRDPAALERLIERKKFARKRTDDITEIQNLEAELEMLKVVSFLE